MNNRDQRAESRTATTLEGVVHVDAATVACHVKDISPHGAKITGASPLAVGAHVTLSLDPFGSVKGEVMWDRDNASGIKFNDRAESIEQILLGLASYAMV